MGPAHRRALTAMDGHRVAMGQVLHVEVVAGEALEAPVVHGGSQLAPFHVHGGYRAALRRHDLAASSRGKRHDAVPGPVLGIPDDQLRTRQLGE